jgi:hypothetical protein
MKAPSITGQARPTSDLAEGQEVSNFCVTENWTGDLGNGLFQVGRIGGYFHGLQEGECGLLTLLRCYEPNDRVNILELLENASSSPSSFCFSTYIICGPGERQPLMCVGESGGFGESTNGTMRGIFIFPRMAPDIHGTH